MDEYLKIMGFQFQLELESNSRIEYHLDTENYQKQVIESFSLIDRYQPDLVIYPELSYDDEYFDCFQELSKDRLIVAGSIYRENHNTTIVFQDGCFWEFSKLYASNQEPMVRFIGKLDTQDALSQIEDHFFTIRDRKIAILNCMEYYHLAYYLAREDKKLFALVSPCCNNKMDLFKTESQALHNHNENIYSIVVNSVGTYNGNSFSSGDSYLYGPIQKQEKLWLKGDGIFSDQQNSSILNLGRDASYFYGEFTNHFNRFGRSDDYVHNPQKVFIKKM